MPLDTPIGKPPIDFTRARAVSDEVSDQVDDCFEYHKWDEMKVAQGTAIRNALANAVKMIIANAPPCPDRSAAIRKLREARMDSNSAITHNGRY
jgi:hypothetical protein